MEILLKWKLSTTWRYRRDIQTWWSFYDWFVQIHLAWNCTLIQILSSTLISVWVFTILLQFILDVLQINLHWIDFTHIWGFCSILFGARHARSSIVLDILRQDLILLCLFVCLLQFGQLILHVLLICWLFYLKSGQDFPIIWIRISLVILFWVLLILISQSCIQMISQFFNLLDFAGIILDDAICLVLVPLLRHWRHYNNIFRLWYGRMEAWISSHNWSWLDDEVFIPLTQSFDLYSTGLWNRRLRIVFSIIALASLACSKSYLEIWLFELLHQTLVLALIGWISRGWA